MSQCPKRMHYGPCGGVRDDGGCEMRPQPCPFTTLTAPPQWAGSPAPLRPPPDTLTGNPVVLTDLTLPAYDPSAVGEIVDVLAPTCDAVLVGEHQNRPDLPPTLMAALIKERLGSRDTGNSSKLAHDIAFKRVRLQVRVAEARTRSAPQS